ncbi:hypothetical protein DY000_02035636 [Brassica cretica]|uniref:Uncharacterized protein n=1 Tax=Brassica cretica TaxID=69181 RepID=A0ABQ7DTM4_BRACR|nr:hypothetical protein DY000_02035636 [Brassica cretica]
MHGAGERKKKKIEKRGVGVLVTANCVLLPIPNLESSVVSGGDGDDGGFWGKIVITDEEQSPDWDSHGLPANIVVQLNKLSGFKKYKVSDIVFFEIRPGGVYTKAQLQKELETLATCGMFEKVDLEGETKPDGTLGVTISFAESTCQSADRFRCFNVGLMVQSKPIEMDADMTDKEKLEYCRSGGWIGRYHVCCMRLCMVS